MPDLCPACGYDASGDDLQTHEGCPCCGYEPRLDEDFQRSAAQWRRRWVENGMPWTSMAVPQPREWDPTRQLDDTERREH